MIKLLKLASYLSIALAVTTVVFAGIGLTGENGTVRERAEFLEKPSVIDQVKKSLKTDKSGKDKISPLVKEAKAFALRIDPPPPPPKPGENKIRKPAERVTNINRVTTPAPPTTLSSSKYKLVATCRDFKNPERSLAMLDITSKGYQWFQQGEMIGHHKIHQINDGNIILDNNGQKSTVSVPAKEVVSSLLKSNNEAIKTTVLKPAGNPASRPSAGNRVTLGNTAGNTTRNTITPKPRQPITRPQFNRPPVRKPLSEEELKARERDAAELKAVLDNANAKSKDKNKKDRNAALMESVLEMLKEHTQKRNESAKPADPTGPKKPVAPPIPDAPKTKPE